jgi:hypothetical protein
MSDAGARAFPRPELRSARLGHRVVWLNARTTDRFLRADGWEDDDHAAALAVFRNTCMDFDEPGLAGLCAIAETAPDARTFFELFFRPVI